MPQPQFHSTAPSTRAHQPRTLAASLATMIDQQVTISGWLMTRRDLGAVSFLVVRDRSGTAQVVVESEELREKLAGLQVESVVAIHGRVVAEPRARGGAELHAHDIDILAQVSEPLPFEINRKTLAPSLDIWLDRAPLALRHESKRAALEITAALVDGYRSALRQRGFVEIFTPKIVGSATEGGANVFPVAYFGRDAYLAQSPQLYKQIMVGVHERVFEVGPVFRAEPHATTRHLNEYISLDLEMGFIQDHRDVMALITELLREMLAAIGERAGAALETLGVTLPAVGDIPIVGFSEAQEIILREFGEDARGEPDLAPQHERWLGEWARREHNSEWFFVEGYPTAKRPFYTMPNPEAPAASNSFDLLFRGLELITGGQREHRYNRLVETMEARQIDPAPFVGYLDAFRFGMPPEGGCAIGLERFVAQLVGAANVREVTAFPRDINRLTP